MTKTIEIKTAQYELIRKSNLFFLRFYENFRQDNYGKEIDFSQWQSVDRDLGISFNAGNFANRSLGYCLCIVEKTEKKTNDKGDVIDGILTLYFHPASSNSTSDWMVIFNNYSCRSQSVEDKYAFIELLWMLDKYPLSARTLESCLRRYNPQAFPFFVQALGKVCKCLSFEKQTIIRDVCLNLGARYEIYMPSIVTELYQALFPNTNDMNSKNLFTLVDDIFDANYNNDLITSKAANNPLAAVLKWLHDEEGLQNYKILKSVYSLLREPLRFDMVKRYFHDIRLHHTNFEIDIVAQFKDNDYSEFLRYRYCVETPGEPVLLTIPLLCDNVITLFNSKGRSFQTFDGVLDFAMTHCDISHPSLNFELERFLPVCDGGVVYNSAFKGFIDYSTIRKIDESKLTNENLEADIITILDHYGRRQVYKACKFNKDTALDKEQIKKCQKYDCMVTGQYEKWIVNIKDNGFIRTFLKEPLNYTNQEATINTTNISIEKFRQYIIDLPKQFTFLGDGEFIVPSYQRSQRSYNLYLIDLYSEILRMRIFPQKGALIGLKYDVFGIWKKVENNHRKRFCQMYDNEKKRAIDEFIQAESEEVRRRTIASLKEDLKSDIINNDFFEVPFDKSLLSTLIKKYYYGASFSEKDQQYQHEFLTTSIITGRFKPFCAPELAKKHNPAIDLPYFWCRGKECFHNCLGNQTLARQNDWHSYSLYHLIEIVGYPKIHETEAGYEPDLVVWQFIAVTNKVAQKFIHLKCRTCGHMLFSSYRVTGFNRFNYYGCINPMCEDNRKLVYLNYCYQCKKGLIDSRDSKQCPNGWYICPSCLSCCDDEQYERLAQRYILSGKQVPDRIEALRGHGHNDKGQYFCPQCGGPIEILTDEEGNTYKGCKTCMRNFDKEGEEKDMYRYR